MELRGKCRTLFYSTLYMWKVIQQRITHATLFLGQPRHFRLAVFWMNSLNAARQGSWIKIGCTVVQIYFQAPGIPLWIQLGLSTLGKTGYPGSQNQL
ncbi:hypothetical protein XELAEV_18010303mg [Xenopus laevis]|uniref:Uncharacterized protein n=1 Tax=Xenopus laevis TaxID=8355 RepID=A0A974I1P6_XENLA|nr:hypothetical protein XELAEV_18010303mg [Xenopus laevis]